MIDVYLHHSLTKDNKILKDFDAIRRYHIQTNKWRDIGYNYVIEFVDGVPVIIKGRNEGEELAHASGYNRGVIAICIVGNYDREYLTESVKNKLIELLDEIANRHNGITIKGHNEVSSKTCPGLNFPLAEIKALYATGFRIAVPKWKTDAIAYAKEKKVLYGDYKGNEPIDMGTLIQVLRNSNII